MRKTLLTACVAILAFQQAAYPIQWREQKGDHFIAYSQGDDRFAKDVLNAAESYYRQIATDLGYPRYSEFWLWDKRVKIYIYPDRDTFVRSTNQPGWSQGMADYRRKEIVSFVGSRDFMDSILPHEIAHLIFRDFVGFRGEVPLWLDEGIAQWAETKKRQMIRDLIKDTYERDSVLSLEDMMSLDVRKVVDQNKVYMRSTTTKTGDKGVLFLSATNLVQVFYLQAAGLVGFLIDKYGSDSLARFCRELRDGKSLDDALRSAYPGKIDSVKDLEIRWRKSIAEGM